jgi:hypothetical protein
MFSPALVTREAHARISGRVAMRLCLCWALAWLGLNALPLAAQELSWAQKMFEKQRLDFGKVATGANCSDQITIRNIYQETIFVTDVRTSCGCAAAKVSALQIPSGQSVVLTVTMDTIRYRGKRDSNAIVTLSEPTKGLTDVVRIPVSVYIRSDVVFTPGVVNFGTVDQGAEAERKIHVAYAGRADWKIVDVLSPKPYLSAKVVETSRVSGTVDYDLLVTLKGNAPLGVLRDQLTLLTDDQGTPHVPLLVEGRVESDFTVTPEVWNLGTVTAGTVKTTNLVVRGRKPFKIQGIECTTAMESFRVVLPPDEKLVHVLPLKFVAPSAPVDIDELFTINVPGRPEPLTFRAQGKVIAAAGKGM